MIDVARTVSFQHKLLEDGGVVEGEGEPSTRVVPVHVLIDADSIASMRSVVACACAVAHMSATDNANDNTLCILCCPKQNKDFVMSHPTTFSS